VSGQLHDPAALPPRTHWVGVWVGPRTGLDHVEKRKFLTLLGLELQPLSRPARSQSLYRLCCPGSYVWANFIVLKGCNRLGRRCAFGRYLMRVYYSGHVKNKNGWRGLKSAACSSAVHTLHISPPSPPIANQVDKEGEGTRVSLLFPTNTSLRFQGRTVSQVTSSACRFLLIISCVA
jgi:hypothetical protein